VAAALELEQFGVRKQPRELTARWAACHLHLRETSGKRRSCFSPELHRPDEHAVERLRNEEAIHRRVLTVEVP
jgi:hypothetical protein